MTKSKTEEIKIFSGIYQMNGGLKLDNKKTTNKTTMCPTTDNDSQLLHEKDIEKG